MRSRSIVTRKALEQAYPDTDLEGFSPTHRVEVLDPRTREVLAEDYVMLGDPEGTIGICFASRPDIPDPCYAMIPPGRWQALNRSGVVRVNPVKYQPDYIPLSDRLGHVYFIQSGGPGGPIKIGWSQDIERRLGELQTANAHVLRVIGKIAGTMQEESATHLRFSHLRMEAEWFQDSPEIHQFLALEDPQD